MMNCLTSRAALLAHPAARDPGLAAHLALCPACRAFAAAIAHDEALLRGAVDVPVPAQLQERILLQAQLRRNCPSTWLQGWFSGLGAPGRAGAALAFAAVMALGAWMARPAEVSHLNWGEVSLAHTIGEASKVRRTELLPQAKLTAVLAAYGLVLNGDLGDIRVVERCPLPGGRGAHIVIDTRRLGQVTLILPPASAKRAGLGAASGEGWSAQVIDIAGVSVGIVTNAPDKLPALAGLLAGHIAPQA